MRRAFLVTWLLAVSAFAAEPEGATTSPPQAPPASPSKRVPPLLQKEETREVDFVFFGTDDEGKPTGGTSPAKIILKPNPSGDVRVAVYEEFSGGAGSQWRASVWMASFLSSTTLGRQLTDYEFGVSTGGLVDGPSAGALTTAAMMAALNGVPVKQDVTMTGTVNPDGSIGPVGGIPQKLKGAADAGKKSFGYPVGQRYDLDSSTEQLEDLHGLAEDRGMAIRELRDIYDAYELLTGQKLARPQPLDATAMDINPKMFKRMQAKVGVWQARTEASVTRLQQKKSPLTEELAPLLTGVVEHYERAARHRKQGLVPVAYQEALMAAAQTEMVLRLTQFLETLAAAEEAEDLDKALQELASVETNWTAFMTRLSADAPESAVGAVNQLAAYETAVGAWASIQIAKAHLAQFKKTLSRLAQGKKLDEEQVLEQLTQPLMGSCLYFSMARLMLESGVDILEMNDDPGKAVRLNEKALAKLVKAYTSAAKANLDYYDALVTAEKAQAGGKSLEVAQGEKASSDPEYLLAVKMLEFALSRRDARGVSAALANLAAAQASYLTSARLIAEEYSLLVEKDEDGKAVRVQNDKAFMAMLELAEQKSREMAATARSATGALPSSIQQAYQTARVQREGSVEDKLDALSSFWSASLGAQLAVTLAQEGMLLAAPSEP